MENVEKSKVLDYMRSITPKRIADYHDFTVAEWNDYWLVVYCKGVKETTFRRRNLCCCYDNKQCFW